MTGADVLRSVSLARAAFAGVPDDGWARPAGTLSWTCWETMEHMADDLFAYAGQLATEFAARGDTYVPFVWRALRDGGPQNTIFVEEAAGTAGLLRALEACGGMLATVVDAAGAERRGWHPYGVSDADGFAAMGVVEVLVHAWDVADTVGVVWTPPAELCQAVLDRLFVDVPAHDDPWKVLLWATGRADLPGFPVRDNWTWDGRPHSERG
ncbi:maleylpyruvate isomerase N-terminal domain-containing protein [Dactylosporangium sp. CS-033363]|uniref:maleylpyruvate isomerase N-terminal domain-containing protein n=1 Tax=Dactylosporangium sp. CS-033363 TaxID=3239935 RepID=UPI003D93FFB4